MCWSVVSFSFLTFLRHIFKGTVPVLFTLNQLCSEYSTKSFFDNCVYMMGQRLQNKYKYTDEVRDLLLEYQTQKGNLCIEEDRKTKVMFCFYILRRRCIPPGRFPSRAVVVVGGTGIRVCVCCPLSILPYPFYLAVPFLFLRLIIHMLFYACPMQLLG